MLSWLNKLIPKLNDEIPKLNEHDEQFKYRMKVGHVDQVLQQVNDGQAAHHDQLPTFDLQIRKLDELNRNP